VPLLLYYITAKKSIPAATAETGRRPGCEAGCRVGALGGGGSGPVDGDKVRRPRPTSNGERAGARPKDGVD
jgi:hypothetical protein